MRSVMPLSQGLLNSQNVAASPHERGETVDHWSLLPSERVLSILQYLGIKDLLSCRLLNRRTVEIIDYFLMCHVYSSKYLPPSGQAFYSQATYDNLFRPWLKAFNANSTIYALDELRERNTFSDSLLWHVCKKLLHTTGFEPLARGHFEHEDAVMAACFSRDGRYIVTGSLVGTVHLAVRNESGMWLERDILQLNDGVKSVIFSPDGVSIATVSLDGKSICIMDVDEAYKLAFKICLRTDHEIVAENFSANGRYLSAAQYPHDKTFIVARNMSDEWIEMDPLPHRGVVPAYFCGFDGCSLVTLPDIWTLRVKTFSGSCDCLWDNAGQVAHGSRIIDVCISPNQCSLVTVTTDAAIRLIVVGESGEWVKKHKCRLEGLLLSATFSCDGRTLAVASSDSVWILIVDDIRHALMIKQQILYHKKLFTPIIHSPNGCALLIPFMDGTAQILARDRNSLWVEKRWVQHLSSEQRACFSPNSHILLTKLSNKKIRILASDGGGIWKDKAEVLNNHLMGSFCFNPDGFNVAVYLDKTVDILMLNPVFDDNAVPQDDAAIATCLSLCLDNSRDSSRG